jgi:hypothetical protein
LQNDPVSDDEEDILNSKIFDFNGIRVVPRSKITGRFRQESTGNRWNVEAVFPSENFRIFSDDFRPVPAEKRRKLTGIHGKKSNKFPVGILLPLPAISGAFLQDPVTFSLLFCRILRDPVTVIFDLG